MYVVSDELEAVLKHADSLSDRAGRIKTRVSIMATCERLLKQDTEDEGKKAQARGEYQRMRVDLAAEVYAIQLLIDQLTPAVSALGTKADQ